jgi:MarR family transcriptional regulator, transcriptional regulator for hemolysin
MIETYNREITEPVGRVMAKIGKIFQAKLLTRLSHLDISRSFYPLLLIEAKEGITQQELARELSCDKVQVVRIIDYLSKNDYVQRIPSHGDKRKHILKITSKAEVMIPEIKNAINETSKIAFNGLTVNQVDELYKMLNLLEINLL